MSAMVQAEALLAQAVELVQAGKVQWQEAPESSGGEGFVGTVDGFRLVVYSFSIENQGFPPGSLGYDGALTSGTAVVRMTREVAEAIHAAATKGNP